MLRNDLEKYAQKIESVKQHIRYITVAYEPEHHILTLETCFLNAPYPTYDQKAYNDRLGMVTEDYRTVFKLVTDVFKQIGIQRIDLGELTEQYDSLHVAVYTNVNQIKSIACIDLYVDPMEMNKGFHEYLFQMSDDEVDDFYIVTRTKDLYKLFEAYERYDLLLQIS